MARVQTAKQAARAPAKPRQRQKSLKESSKDGAGERFESRKSNGKLPEHPIQNRDGLREEILSLGGDDEDFELLKDVDSDNDVLAAGNSKKDAGLSKDLANFMKDLNFASVNAGSDDASDEDGDEGSDETEEREDEGSLSEVTSDAVEQQPEKKDVKQMIDIPKAGPNSSLLIEPTPQWYSALPSLSSTKTPTMPPSPSTITSKQAHASNLHVSELAAYTSATSASKLASSFSDAAFLQRVLTSGTLSDRLSALTLLAQSSPLHNTRALEILRGMAQKKGREESLKALRAVCDWWIGGGTPDRKLKYFADQPLTHPGVTDKHLVTWYFEDWMKKYFYSILQILETLSLDPLPYVRLQAMSLIFTLLRDKPEQEQNLLRLLVNKLGDSERSVASRASYHLLQLLQAHPSMKAVVVREVTSLVLRPLHKGAAASAPTNSGATHLKFADELKSAPKSKAKKQDKPEKKDLQQEHSKYYAAITLNQIMLAPTEADRAVARQLISLYFELFKEILGTPANPLNGDAASEAGEGVDHSRYGKEKRKRQEGRGGKGKDKDERQEGGFVEVEDSNSRLISAILTGVNRALPFAKLSLEDVEFSKHIDTIFLISHKSTFNISLQALRLIMQICQSLASYPSSSTSSSNLYSSITDRYYRSLYTSLFDVRLNTSSKHVMYLNLFLKSLKMDTKAERVKAFVRRFVQLLVNGGTGGVEFVAGGLYLLGELVKTQPAVRDLLGKPKHTPAKDDLSNEYDPRKRDPQYANAGASPMWELTPLLSHYHPTVRLHTSQLLSGTDLTANADLTLNTLSHFLDRFVYKNPKKPRPKGPSAMQPGAAAVHDGSSIRIVKGASAGGVRVVNDEMFLRKDVDEVPVDQVFFHKYFSQKNGKERAKAEKAAKRRSGVHVDSENEEEGDEEKSDSETEMKGATEKVVKETGDDGEDEVDESEGSETEIWKAMQATNPDLNSDASDSEVVFPEDDDSNSDSDSESFDSDADASKPHTTKSASKTDGIEDAVSESEEGKEAEEGEDEDGENGEEVEEDDEALSLAEHSDAEDLISLNDLELPEGLITHDSDPALDSEAEHGWEGFDTATNTNTGQKKRKRKDSGKGQKDKKKRRRALPTFATYEDYAKLIEGQPEDNI